MSIAEPKWNRAWLGKDFGEELARKWFGDAAVDALPRYTSRSKYAGKIKAEIHWLKIERGGCWHFANRQGAYVIVRPGIVYRALVIPEWGEENWPASGVTVEADVRDCKAVKKMLRIRGVPLLPKPDPQERPADDG